LSYYDVTKYVNGTTRQKLTKGNAENISFPLPPLTEQKRIASLLARADRLRQLRRTAHDLSASVLQSVFLEMFGDIAKNEKGWNAEKLEDLCDEITVGYVGPMQSEYNQGGVVFLRSQNIKPFRIDLNDVKYVSPEFHKKLKKSAIYPGNVVVVRTGLAGTAAVVPDNFPTANCSDLVIIRPSSKINNQYLAMLFNSTWGKGHVSGNAVGQIQQHFNIGSANEMKVPLPPLALQEEFARVVARVESLRGRMSEAERLVEGLFESLRWIRVFRVEKGLV
jgi:type I restriction enzyme S subunit